MTNIAPCPNPWCSSQRRDALGSKPFIFPNDSDGGPVRVSCPVCPMEGPTEDSVAEAIEAWNHRVSPSQVATANPAQVTEFDAVELDMIRRGDMLGSKLGVRVYAALTGAQGAGNEGDGQPDEAQEWHDYDPDC